MHVSAKSDYALRALIVLAGSAADEDDADGLLPAEAMATEQEIPQNFLLAILADLRRGGIVRSRRGQGGGWSLARDPSQISVADVIRAVDGPLVSVNGRRPEQVSYKGSTSALQLVWIAARSSLRDVLETTTLADLVTGELPEQVQELSKPGDSWEPRV